VTVGSVAPNGTLNFGGGSTLFCVEDKVLTVSSTTAADNPITDDVSCSL
jgi:hypothetical protein